MLTYEQHALKPSSEKITCLWIEPRQQLKTWELYAGSVYRRTVNYYTVGVAVDSVLLSEGSSESLSSGEWFFDYDTKLLYIRLSDDSAPTGKDVAVTYRLFYSNKPLILNHDLDNGDAVEYEARLSSASPATKELDSEQIGIALESNSSVGLINTDGFFDDIFDTLFWEFAKATIWSVVPGNQSEKRKLFEGITKDKSFSTDRVSFSLKDFIYQLRQPLVMETYQTSDGELSDDVLGTVKKRIYGQADGVRCIGLDLTLDGYPLTGTISANTNGTTVTGVGTDFLNELSGGDKISVIVANRTFEIGVDTVNSATEFTASEEVEVGFSGLSATNNPEIPYRGKNRRWHIAGHKLRQPTTTLTEVVTLSRIRVADPSDIFEDDLIELDGTPFTVRDVRGDIIILRTQIQGTPPSIGASVIKSPVSNAYIESLEIFINRDWDTTNTSSDAIIEIDPLAEFNVTVPRLTGGSYTFTNGSRDVTVTGIEVENFIGPRDWILSDDISHQVWYEVLSAESGTITLRTAYAGTNVTGTAKRKNVQYLDDDSLVTVNCTGYERSGVWVRNASQAVKDILENDAAITTIDNTSFDVSSSEAPFTLSLVINDSVAPKINDVITEINKSVFGSLVNDSEFNLRYNILSTEKPEDLETIYEDDLSNSNVSVSTKNEIIREVNANYSKFTDRFTGNDTAQNIFKTSQFVDNFIGSKEGFNIDIELYDQGDAETIAERYLLFNSLSQSILTLKSSLNLSNKNLNDKIYIELDRIYKRFGNQDRRKIGIINKITKTGETTEITINDLGNLFNRVMSIAPNTSSDFDVSSDDDRIRYCYIVDNDTELPSDDENFSNVNRIG